MLVSKDKKQTLYEDGISPSPSKQENGSGNNSTVTQDEEAHGTQYGYQGELILPTAPDYVAPELPTLPEYNDVTGFKTPDPVNLPEYSAPADFSAPSEMIIPEYVTPDAFSAPTIDRSGSDRWQAQLDAIYAEITGRAPFEFDLNGETLYQQYRDAALRDGALAMRDTAAQGAALSGGYGSSYSQSAAQQSYNAQLEQLNDRIPDIYAAALDRYDREYKAVSDEYDRQLDLTALYNDYLAAKNENSASGSSDTAGSEADDGTDIDGMSDTEIYEILNTMLSRGGSIQQIASQIALDPRLETRSQRAAALEILDYVTKNAALK